MNATRAPNKRLTRLRVGLLAGVAVLLSPLLGVGAGAASAASAPPQPTSAERAEALVAPSLVYIGVHWKGWVQVPSHVYLGGGVTLHSRGWDGPFTVNTICSGFVVDPAGYVVTAGHCVDDQSMTSGGKAALISAAVAKIARLFPQNTPSQLATLRDAIESTGKVEAKASGSPPQRTVTVYPLGVTSATGLVAQTVAFKAITGGDVALLKVTPRSPLPAVIAAPQAPPIGTSVFVAGYAGSMSGLVDPNQEPSFKNGETSSQQTINGVPFTEVSAAMTAGMSGGPAVDSQGRVIGTVSFRPGGETQAFNFITATSSLVSLLAGNGVANKLSATDIAYRSGLTAMWAGRYHDAVVFFDKVLAVQPDNERALQYKRQSIENYPNDVEKGGSNAPLFIGIGAGVLVILGAATFFMLRRRRGAPPQVVTPAYEPVIAPAGGAAVAQPVPTPEPVLVATAPAPPTEASVLAPPPVIETPPVATPPVEEHAGGFCPNCGTPHEQGAHFCEACGEHFKELVSAGKLPSAGHS